MALLITLFSILFVVVSIAMILIVLIQRPQGGGLSGAFGAGGPGASQTAFGAKTGDVLTLVTVGIFVAFLAVSIVLVLLTQARYSATAVTRVPPRDPTNLQTIVLSADAVRLTWTDNADLEERYVLERSLTGGRDAWEVVDAEIPDNTVQFTDSGLEPGTQYFYRLRAENEEGRSGAASASAATFEAPPDEETETETDEQAETGDGDGDGDGGEESGDDGAGEPAEADEPTTSGG